MLSLLHGDVRPEMVAMLDRVKAAGLLVACLTNNVIDTAGDRTDESPDAVRNGVPARRIQEQRRWRELERDEPSCRGRRRCSGH